MSQITVSQLNAIQRSFYERYRKKYLDDSFAIALASIHGISVDGGSISDPEIFVANSTMGQVHLRTLLGNEDSVELMDEFFSKF